MGDHPTQVNLHSEDARGEVEGSEGGRLPDMYVVVRNNELLKIRYIMIYRHESSAVKTERGIISTWVGQNRMLLLLLAYAAMLALIVGEEVAEKERLYELSSISLHPRKLSMQTACFIVIALINSALLSIYGMWLGIVFIY